MIEPVIIGKATCVIIYMSVGRSATHSGECQTT